MIGLPSTLTLGTFDLLHKGHVNLLKRCIRLADGGTSHVGVNSDRFVERYKGHAPACPESVRMTTVQAYGVPWVNDGPGAYLIHVLRPAFLVIGSDWAERDYFAQIGMTPDELFGLGVSLVYVPRTPGVSSSGMRA